MTKQFSILAVDDDRINLQLITKALKDEYNVVTALNGYDAISLLKGQKTDLILLDVMMPDLNGFEVCSIIKADASFVDIPIIFLTALDTHDGAIRGFEIGAIDYLTKPIDFELLKLRVRNHIEMKERNDLIREQWKLLARQKEELQAKNDELERFTYTVSHDLKSPLITIQTFAGMILQNMDRGDHTRVAGDLKRIEDAAVKMTAMLSDLLKLSLIGRVSNPAEMINMNQLVDTVLALLAGSLEEQSIRLIVQQDLPAVMGDSQRLMTVVQNLVENAIKYRGDQAEAVIEIGSSYDDGQAVFFVRDNGKGVDPRFHENIFGLFNKLDPKSKGTGVGLALVRRIIEVHGGRVWVESAGEGHGSCFYFSLLPADSETEAAQE